MDELMAGTSLATPPRMNVGASPRPLPVRTTINGWIEMTGMGRTATFAALKRGDLTAVKVGARTLIHVASGLDWLNSQPAFGGPKKAA